MTLEPRLPNPVELAIPAFILLVLLEIGVARAKGLSAYELRDTAASLATGSAISSSGLVPGPSPMSR